MSKFVHVLGYEAQGNKTKEMYYSLLSLKMIPFVLFPQASEPSVNFKILKLVYWKVFTGIITKFTNYTAVVLQNQT